MRLTRRGKLAGAAMILVASVGITKLGVEAVDVMTDTITCEASDATHTMQYGENVRNAIAIPSAEQYQIPIDAAMYGIREANPDVASLGEVQAGQEIVIPTCKVD